MGYKGGIKTGCTNRNTDSKIIPMDSASHILDSASITRIVPMLELCDWVCIQGGTKVTQP